MSIDSIRPPISRIARMSRSVFICEIGGKEFFHALPFWIASQARAGKLAGQIIVDWPLTRIHDRIHCEVFSRCASASSRRMGIIGDVALGRPDQISSRRDLTLQVAENPFITER